MTGEEPLAFSERIRKYAERLAREGVSALGPLYDLTAHRLVRYALAIACNQHDAEDAVQTALERIAMRPRLLANPKVRLTASRVEWLKSQGARAGTTQPSRAGCLRKKLDRGKKNDAPTILDRR